MSKIKLAILIALFPVIVSGQEKVLTKGMKITKTTKIKRGTYKIDASALSNASVITITGNNITIDFNNAVLKGSNKKINPDDFFGIGIVILQQMVKKFIEEKELEK